MLFRFPFKYQKRVHHQTIRIQPFTTKDGLLSIYAFFVINHLTMSTQRAFVLSAITKYTILLCIMTFPVDLAVDHDQQICIYRLLIVAILLFYHQYQTQDLQARLYAQIVTIRIYHILRRIIQTFVVLRVRNRYHPHTFIEHSLSLSLFCNETENSIWLFYFFTL